MKWERKSSFICSLTLADLNGPNTVGLYENILHRLRLAGFFFFKETRYPYCCMSKLWNKTSVYKYFNYLLYLKKHFINSHTAE